MAETTSPCTAVRRQLSAGCCIRPIQGKEKQGTVEAEGTPEQAYVNFGNSWNFADQGSRVARL